MTDREKIIEIIAKEGVYNGRSLSFDYYVVQPDDLANALIEAGIGDVIEYKHKAEVAERVIANILCADACYFCNEKHGDCNVQHHDYGSKECIDRLLRLAEKELQEEK